MGKRKVVISWLFEFSVSIIYKSEYYLLARADLRHIVLNKRSIKKPAQTFKPEIAHATPSLSHQVIRDCHFETLGAVVLDIEGESFLEEPQADIVLSDRMQNEANVGVYEGHLGVILPTLGREA